jgi:hypothetical protein
VLAQVVRSMTPRRPRSGQGVPAVSFQVIWPWLVVLLVAGLTALVLRQTTERTASVGLDVLVVLGVAAVNVPKTMVTTLTDQVCVAGPDRPECRQTRRQVPSGGAEAARYIRDHSAVGDKLATNSHCTPVYADRNCDARNFWLAAYAERRVLVEGWAYTPTAQSRQDGDAAISGPFWDRPLLQLNDRAFKRPSKRILDQLWIQYGVRWLVFDTNLDWPPRRARQPRRAPLQRRRARGLRADRTDGGRDYARRTEKFQQPAMTLRTWTRATAGSSKSRFSSPSLVPG